MRFHIPRLKNVRAVLIYDLPEPSQHRRVKATPLRNSKDFEARFAGGFCQPALARASLISGEGHSHRREAGFGLGGDCGRIQ